LFLLLLLLPVVVLTVPFVAIAVKLSSRGPVFFKQQRVGADGQLFSLFKFRTMYVNNDDSIHREYVAALMRGEASQHNGIYKLVNDPRVTPVGRLLRRYSLDEIPQLWNVLRGDMSIIGPRPPLLTESQGYDATAWNRLRVTPGLTGLWQVSGRCSLSFKEMVDLDIAYWRDWSPMLDVRILARTPVALATTKGAA
jgi:lipopolysaccharide/colanic/teichoic acid biosynthesis glycosyltransferase